jgi:hypothetical protein
MSKEIKTILEQEFEKYKVEYIMDRYIDDSENCFDAIYSTIDILLKAQEEKHKEEMEKFAEWLAENRWIKSVTPNFFIRIENRDDVAERVPTTELIEMFKKSITANG